MAGSDALIGRTVARHGVIEKLGSGDTGVVLKAEDTRLDRLVALKFMPEDLARERQAPVRLRVTAFCEGLIFGRLRCQTN
jgi:serine/threonine protein kinase